MGMLNLKKWRFYYLLCLFPRWPPNLRKTDKNLSLSDNNQTDIIEAFNSASRYLDDLLNIDNPYFEQMVGQMVSY